MSVEHSIFNPVANSDTRGDRSAAFWAYFPNDRQAIASETKTTFFCPYFPVQMRTEARDWPLVEPATPKRNP